MNQGLIAIIITIGIIIGAIKTRRCIECMLIGSFVAAAIAFKGQFLYKWCEILQKMLADNAWVFLVCLLFGALISLLTESKGSLGFTKYLEKFCTNERRTLLTTFFMGILICIDDYLNVMSVGTCMKKICDDREIPRESLAYMLDSTGAPACVILPISTWAVYYAALFYGQESVRAMGFTSAISAYMSAIPFCFYPWVTLIIVFLFAMGIMPKFGTMKSAYEKKAEICKRKSEEEEEVSEEGNIILFLIPMVILIATAIISRDVLVAVVVALAVCFVLYVPCKKIMGMDEFMNNIVAGFGDMIQVLIMLLVTFVLKEVCAQMGMTQYIIHVVQPYLIPAVFPAMVFILGAVLAFTTGSDWGMSTMIVPIVFPLGQMLGSNPILIMAAVISGGTFGSHACFYADATLLAAKSSGISSMEHALSQIPYVMIACVISTLGFVITGYVV